MIATAPTLRPYQARAAEFLAARVKGLVVCPAGGGKTIIGASALAQIAADWDSIGWACNTREQVEQGERALAALGVKAAWVKCVAGIQESDTVGLDFLVLDEVHHLPAESWHRIAGSCPGRIWGLTATPRMGDPDRDAWFERYWVGHVFTVPRSEVMAGGHLAQGVVRIIDIDELGEFDATINEAAKIETLKGARRWPRLDRQELYQRARWRSTLEMLMENPSRIAATVRVAREEAEAGASVLVLVAEVAQGERLAEQIPGAVLVHSGLGAKKRRVAIEGFRDGSLSVMVATSLADEGMDVPRAGVLILATVGKSSRLVEQRTGRVMRPFAGKDEGVVYDFADRGAKMAHNQHRQRLVAYRKLGYSIQKLHL